MSEQVFGKNMAMKAILARSDAEFRRYVSQTPDSPRPGFFRRFITGSTEVPSPSSERATIHDQQEGNDR